MLNFHEYLKYLKKNKVFGMMTEDELQALLLCVMNHDVDGDIVEIGAWAGLSTILLAMGETLSRLHRRVITIDHFKGSLEHQAMLKGKSTYSMFMRNISLCKVKDKIKVLQMDSQEAHKLLDQQISILFLDGSHMYPHVKKELKYYPEKVKKNGLILIHDYEPQWQTKIAVDEWIQENEEYEKVVLINTLLIVRKK
ncbi:class I SAM-dependent methyltransferase [Chengkuizengella marina]|uniref:Class I SAM-dependent methyltransferase n=1 Tax=Chengkuizengella marina TaxID=2507566 RepID=A0A6N9Q4S8_9BACL|nr:class I SAM-dependent methyltransferase [Chengkuizengella marina]NBI29838.1 class I SAM-dependent methyltransferase [Chengkuizengella marina]